MTQKSQIEFVARPEGMCIDNTKTPRGFDGLSQALNKLILCSNNCLFSYHTTLAGNLYVTEIKEEPTITIGFRVQSV